MFQNSGNKNFVTQLLASHLYQRVNQGYISIGRVLYKIHLTNSLPGWRVWVMGGWSRSARDLHPRLVWCRASVADGGPILNRHCATCLLGAVNSLNCYLARAGNNCRNVHHTFEIKDCVYYIRTITILKTQNPKILIN